MVLGAFPTALYLRLAGGEVIALLTRDAVLLPLGLRLTTHSADHPLNRWTGPVRVGSSQVQVGDWSVRLTRVVSVQAPKNLEPNCRAIEYASRTLGRSGQVEPRPGLLEVLLGDQRVLAAGRRRRSLSRYRAGTDPFRRRHPGRLLGRRVVVRSRRRSTAHRGARGSSGRHDRSLSSPTPLRVSGRVDTAGECAFVGPLRSHCSRPRAGRRPSQALSRRAQLGSIHGIWRCCSGQGCCAGTPQGGATPCPAAACGN